jgi:hypothetical protein
MKNSSLTKLGLKHGADKALDTHNYTDVYPIYIEKFRHEPLTLIELGTFKGASCRMWDEYFTNPNAKLIGYDHLLDRVTKFLPDSPRWTGIQGDQWEKEDLEAIAEQWGPFDVVLDDCVHGAAPQEYTLEAFWPHIKPGGVHIIEDINFSSYNDRWYETRVKKGPRSVMPYLNTKLDECLQQESVGKGFPGRTPPSDIKFIHFWRHMAVLGKK